MMGIVVVGNREIAAVCEDRTKLNKTYSCLLTINMLFTFVVSILLLILIFLVPQFSEHRNLLFVGLIKLVFNFLTVDWLYKGLEKFKYVTICNLTIKIIYVLSVFVFVKSEADYPVYYVLSVLSIVVTALINIVYSRYFVTYTFNLSGIKSVTKPFMIYGLYTILTSAYTTLNITYLGFVSGEVEVGYYTTATKLFTIIISLFTALTGVILPRASSLFSQGKTDELEEILQKTVNLLFSLGAPLVVFGIVCARSIIYIIAGSGYEGAILPMQISMPLIIVIGLEQILIIQGLMPMKQDWIVMRGTIIGAVLSIITNLLFTSFWASVGAAVVWFMSEVAVLINAQISMKKLLGLQLPYTSLLKSIIAYMPLLVLLLLVNAYIHNLISGFVICSIISLIYFIITEILICKNMMLTQYINRFVRK